MLSRVRQGTAAPPTRGGLGTALAGVAAALGSAALAYWVSSGEGGEGPALPKPRPAAASPRPSASLETDAAAVRRAYRSVGDVYSERGLPGVMEIADGCPQAVASDPLRLDFCVAFALDGAALAANSDDPVARAWRQGQPAAQLAVIGRALPAGADAGARLASIQRLTRIVAAPPPLKRASLAKPARRCPSKALPLARTLCLHPGLRADAGHMQAAYRAKLEHAGDRPRLQQEQALWREKLAAAATHPEALQQLYRDRTRELLVSASDHRPPWPYD